jgi:N6-L-threonylcarbamoyladenine synthase
MIKILAIESSCDETAIAALEASEGSLLLQKNLIHSQVDIHKKYGGVIPELAARQHLQNIFPLLDEALGDQKINDFDYLAVTQGPGLITSLLLGINVAKTLAYASQKPLIAVNHLEGHIYSNWLSHDILVKNSKSYFPSVVLIVSGGHTELVLMKNHGDYQLLGQTLDDAVGEAFDKVAKLLLLGYPGGPIVSAKALKGNPNNYVLPRPMLNSQNFDFSLSGLKTAVLYSLEKQGDIDEQSVADICAAFEAAVIEVLVKKTMAAVKSFGAKSIMLAGGVAANKKLAASLQAAAQLLGLPFFAPEQKFTGDNAAMIAAAAYYQIISKKTNVMAGSELLNMEPRANWQLTVK